MRALRRELTAALAALCVMGGWAAEDISVMGFSDGGAVALDLAAYSGLWLAGAVSISGPPLPDVVDDRAFGDAPVSPVPPILVTHGTADDRIPLADAQAMVGCRWVAPRSACFMLILRHPCHGYAPLQVAALEARVAPADRGHITFRPIAGKGHTMLGAAEEARTVMEFLAARLEVIAGRRLAQQPGMALLSDPLPATEREAQAAAAHDAGNAAYRAQRYADAANHYARAIGRQPGRATAWANLAACHLALRAPESALVAATVAAHLDPRNPKSWYRQADALRQLRRPAEARVALARCAELQSGADRAKTEAELAALYSK